MKSKFAIICLAIATLLAPMVLYAADSDADRTKPMDSERTKPMDSDRSKPMTFVKDSVITTKIKAKLAAEKMSNLARIKVDTTQQGVVVLSGTVKTQEEADQAVSIARETQGVTMVSSNIQIKP